MWALRFPHLLNETQRRRLIIFYVNLYYHVHLHKHCVVQCCIVKIIVKFRQIKLLGYAKTADSIFVWRIFVLFEFRFRTPGAIKVGADGQEHSFGTAHNKNSLIECF